MKEKIKSFVQSRYAKLAAVGGAAASALAVGAFADTTTSEYATATSALTTALGSLKTEALSILASVVGIAVVLMGGYFLIKLGMKWFKGLAK